MNKRTDDRPRHIQIAADLRSKILSGDLAESLPSFSQLMRQYDTAGSTAQRAVGLLKAEGFVEGQHGKGLVILPKQFEIIDVMADAAPSTTNIAHKLLRVGPERPPADAARKLGLEDGATAILRQQLTLRDQDPIEIAWSYYPASIGSGTVLDKPEQISADSSATLESLGWRQHKIVDEFVIREPTTEEVEALDLPANTPVMRRLRTSIDERGTVLEATITVKGGHLFGMRYERTMPPSSIG
jgi:GntR family transcriptional regulator